MPPTPSGACTMYTPSRRSVSIGETVSLNICAAASRAGPSRKFLALPARSSSAWTSDRRAASPWHSPSRNASRPLLGCSSAAWKIRSISRQVSGSIGLLSTAVVLDVRLPAHRLSPSHSGIELFQEPAARHPPIASHRVWRAAEHPRGLFHAQACKESELDDTHLARIDGAECVERVIQRNEIDGSVFGFGSSDIVVERHVVRAAAALGRGFRARQVDEHTPHRAGGNGEKVVAIVPINLPRIMQPYEGFMHQRCRLK